MGQDITLTSSDGFEFDAYRCEAEGTPKGAVVAERAPLDHLQEFTRT